MDFVDSMKVLDNKDTTNINTNTQVYKTIGSLNFYKDEQTYMPCFKCNGMGDYNIDAFFSGTMNNNNNNNNNNVSQTRGWNSSESNDTCMTIDGTYCHSNQSYYNDLVKHIFVNNGAFYANDVCNLAEYIVKYQFNLTQASRMLSHIYLQYQLLLESGYSISYVDMEDILVMGNDSNELLFFFSNYDKIYKTDTMERIDDCIGNCNDSIRVIHFYDHDNFVLPPELIENTDIPFTCHKSDWLYSLACVVLCCFNPGKIEDMGTGTGTGSSDHNKHEYIMKMLSEYTGTKMYYTLLYCLSKEPGYREFILF
jgi:hypothetical protein